MTDVSTQAKAAEIVPIKTAKTAKLNPRVQGGIGYQLGRLGTELYVRIISNDSSGTFSKEWVPVAAIERLLNDPSIKDQPFKASALAEAFQKKSQNNAGFLAAVLRAEQITTPAGEMGQLSIYNLSLEPWKASMLELPVDVSVSAPGENAAPDGGAQPDAQPSTEGQSDAQAQKPSGKKSKKAQS